MQKTSGNGSRNLAAGKKNLIKGFEEKSNKNREEIYFIEYDRPSFCCEVRMHVGYFLCISEMLMFRLTGTGIQMGDVKSK